MSVKRRLYLPLALDQRSLPLFLPMKLPTPCSRGILPALLIAGAFSSALAQTRTAFTLSDFGGIEEPAVIYNPGTDTFTSDSFPNITDEGGGRYRMYLRFRANQWWDGDRTTTSEDRQRAEVKVLGPRQKPGQTFEYASTWRTDPAMVVGNRFCHITQVKGYGSGDIGTPLITTTLRRDNRVNVEFHSSGGGDGNARSWTWAPGAWTRSAIRLKISTNPDGYILASVNGDAFTGVTNRAMYRTGAPEYQPKWGLYRGADNSQPFGDNYMEHELVTATVIDAPPPPPPPTNQPPPAGTLLQEAERLPLSSVGAGTAVQNDSNNSEGKWMALQADGAGDYVDYTLSPVPAGTYRLKFKYKGHPSRGQLTLHLDGAQIGGVIDQYSANSVYPVIDFGLVTFPTESSHIVRLTCVGRNPASDAYTLSADYFFLDDGLPPATAIGTPVEVETLPFVANGASTAPQSDANNSGGRWLALQASRAGPYIEFTLGRIPRGTYTLLMKYKSHPGRGTLVASMDGAALGGPIDQYSNPQAYPEVTLGTVRFAASGSHTLRLTCIGRNPASSAFTLSADTITLVPDTNAPELELPEDIIVEATSPAGATVNFDVTATDAEDGVVPVTVTPPSGSVFPLGMTFVSATARDFAGNETSGKFVVAVADLTPPTIATLQASPDSLWPANHKMVPVTISAEVADIADPAPRAKIVAVASNEPANGSGDGNTNTDWRTTGDLTLELRAERSGGGTGRIYTITVEATDASGNVSQKTIDVHVTHDRGKA